MSLPYNAFQIHKNLSYLVLGIILTAATILAGCCGNPDNDVIVAKLSPTGALCWTKEFNCGGYTIIYAATPTSDGGCTFSAMMNGTSSGTHWLNADGTVRWVVWGASNAITQGKSGDIICIYNGGGTWLYSPDGTLLVNRTVPELVRPAGDEYARYPPSVIGTSDGEYAACGAFGVVKLDAYGNVTWKVGRQRAPGFTSVVEGENGDFLATEYDGVLSLWKIHHGEPIGEPIDIVRYNRTHDPQSFLYKDPRGDGYWVCHNRGLDDHLLRYETLPGGINTSYRTTPTWICERLSNDGTPTGVHHTLITTSSPLVGTQDGGFFTAAGISQSSDELKELINTDPGLHAVKLDATGSILWETNVPITLSWGVKKIVATTDGGYVIIGLTHHH